MQLQIEEWRLDRVRPYERNPRIVPESAVEKVAASLKEFGWRQPLVVDEGGVLVVGHTRRLAAIRLGLKRVPVHVARGLSEAQLKAYRLADNRTGEETSWADDLLRLEVAELEAMNYDVALTGFGAVEVTALLGDQAPAPAPGLGSLQDRFGIPPFSVLNAREGWWQERKRAWLALGIQSELGRGENLLAFSETILEPDPEKRRKKHKALPGGGGGGCWGRGGKWDEPKKRARNGKG